MVRYFSLVTSRPPYSLAVLAAVTIYGAVLTHTSREELDSGLGMVLFVQMFLVSSGFAASARRGHYDPVLVHGSNRVVAIAAEWCASVVPGAVAWMLLAVAGYLIGSPAALSALAGTRLIAFFIVSALASSMGFVLPRGAAGVLWTAVLMVLLLRHADMVGPFTAAPSTLVALRGAGALLLCPFLLLGTHGQPGLAPQLMAAAMAGAVLVTTWCCGARMDVILAERS